MGTEPTFYSAVWPYVCTHAIPSDKDKCLCGNYMRVEVPESEQTKPVETIGPRKG